MSPHASGSRKAYPIGPWSQTAEGGGGGQGVLDDTATSGGHTVEASGSLPASMLLDMSAPAAACAPGVGHGVQAQAFQRPASAASSLGPSRYRTPYLTMLHDMAMDASLAHASAQGAAATPTVQGQQPGAGSSSSRHGSASGHPAVDAAGRVGSNSSSSSTGRAVIGRVSGGHGHAAATYGSLGHDTHTMASAHMGPSGLGQRVGSGQGQRGGMYGGDMSAGSVLLVGGHLGGPPLVTGVVPGSMPYAAAHGPHAAADAHPGVSHAQMGMGDAVGVKPVEAVGRPGSSGSPRGFTSRAPLYMPSGIGPARSPAR